MIWWVYNILFGIGFVLLLPRFLWRMRRRGGYRRNFGQRLALYDASVRKQLAAGEPRIWVHAVSVGEMFIAFRFMEVLRQHHPSCSFVVTTTTSTGYTLAEKRVQKSDVLLYFPLDIPPVMRRVLNRIRPRLVVLVEYELWPNLIRRCQQTDVPVVLINGRVSANSFNGYRKLQMFTRRLLPLVNTFCVQGDTDAKRLVQLGAPADRVRVVGSAKYELADRDPAGEARIGEVLRAAGWAPATPILVGGSTWPGEEVALVQIVKHLRDRMPALRLVLAPRHVERAAEVVRVIEAAGWRYARRSQLSAATTDGMSLDVVLIDTTGELRHVYAHATVIFVGKSLTQHGGQNIAEAAPYGRPIVVGPNMENFPVLMEDFLAHDAIVQVPDKAGLATALSRLFENQAEREQLGASAAGLVAARVGAMDRTLAHIEPLLASHDLNRPES